MEKNKKTRTPKNGNDKGTSTFSCPKCGRELKPMRCRIDGMELYCPSCRFTFDPAVFRK